MASTFLSRDGVVPIYRNLGYNMIDRLRIDTKLSVQETSERSKPTQWGYTVAKSKYFLVPCRQVLTSTVSSRAYITSAQRVKRQECLACSREGKLHPARFPRMLTYMSSRSQARRTGRLSRRDY
jgi:hypothetical protein